MNAGLLPLTLFAPVLLYAGLSDLRRMRIPNWTSLVAVAVFALAIPLLGLAEAGWRALFAGAIFGIGLALWSLRLFGAGDVKLLSALVLLVPSAQIGLFWNLFAVCLLVGLALVTGLRAIPAMRQTGWVSMRAERHFPMGISIALAGITLPLVAGL